MPPQRECARKRDRWQAERGKDEVGGGRGPCGAGRGGLGGGRERVFPTKLRSDVRDPLRKEEKKRLDGREERSHWLDSLPALPRQPSTQAPQRVKASPSEFLPV